jgi:hypothetical protein
VTPFGGMRGTVRGKLALVKTVFTPSIAVCTEVLREQWGPRARFKRITAGELTGLQVLVPAKDGTLCVLAQSFEHNEPWPLLREALPR